MPAPPTGQDGAPQTIRTIDERNRPRTRLGPPGVQHSVRPDNTPSTTTYPRRTRDADLRNYFNFYKAVALKEKNNNGDCLRIKVKLYI